MTSVVKQIYKLRRDFILIGLTGRTGSGCTSVAKILETNDFSGLKTEYREINSQPWDNVSRKNRIVHNYMQQHWHKFTVITASNIIFYYALMLDFDEFVDEFSHAPLSKTGDNANQEIVDKLTPLETNYNDLHERVKNCEETINNKEELTDKEVAGYLSLIGDDITTFREELMQHLQDTKMRIIGGLLQKWGNTIRRYDNVIQEKKTTINNEAPACLAHKINLFIKLLRSEGKKRDKPTLIVIDALRNPYEVLYFRERYSAFYLMSINTTEQIRRQKLIEKGYNIDEISQLDEGEKEKKDIDSTYMQIDINKCIELSDIHLTHDGTKYDENRNLINQIVTYLALIRHPGLIPPSSEERVMQIAYTAKLNSGCLSRQVGAAVTNKDFSVQSIGWNTVAQGQTPCSLRNISDLYQNEDEFAYSDHELRNEDFKKATCNLCQAYSNDDKNASLLGLPNAYCFKDIHTSITEKQQYNQVHTRSLHAEENSFLQLAKYGTQGIEGGKLFTTSSCCELCAKKAYQLGIKEIYYIDSYPGITFQHIISSGIPERRPKMVLFHGAIGRAYSNLYNPFMPLKDEIEALSGVHVKEMVKGTVSKSELKSEKND